MLSEIPSIGGCGLRVFFRDEELSYGLVILSKSERPEGVRTRRRTPRMCPSPCRFREFSREIILITVERCNHRGIVRPKLLRRQATSRWLPLMHFSVLSQSNHQPAETSSKTPE